jgi:hypothetical protein
MCGWDIHDAYQGPTIADDPGHERAGALAGG